MNAYTRVCTRGFVPFFCVCIQSLSTRKHAELAQAVEDAFTSLKAGAESFKREQEAAAADAAAAEEAEEAEGTGTETEDTPPPEPATDSRKDESHAGGGGGDGGGGGEENAHNDNNNDDDDDVSNGEHVSEDGKDTKSGSGDANAVRATLTPIKGDGEDGTIEVRLVAADLAESASAATKDGEEATSSPSSAEPPAPPPPPPATSAATEEESTSNEETPASAAAATTVDATTPAMEAPPSQDRRKRRESFRVPWEVAASLRCLRLAIETKQTKLVDPALSCLQQLLSMEHLRGECVTLTPQEEADVKQGRITAPPTPTAGVVVDMLCFPAEHCSDEALELQVLRCLLTAITSLAFKIHGEALLKCIRCSYNIFLSSKSFMNSNTAKATLTQIVTTIFTRMEADDDVVLVKPIVVKDVLSTSYAASGSDGYYNTAVSNEESSITLFVQSFVNRVVQDIEQATSSSLQQQAAADFLVDFGGAPGAAAAAALDNGDDDDDEFRSRTLSAGDSVDDEDRDVYLGGRETTSSSPSSSLDKQQSSPSSQQMLSSASETDETTREAKRAWLDGCAHPHLRRDAYLVFRTLCKLSMKQPSPTTSSQSAAQVQAQEQQQFRGKVLALELIKLLLTNAGPQLLCNAKFISAIKQYLCLSLLRNCTAITTSVAKQASSGYFSGYQQQQQHQQQVLFSLCASVLVSLLLRYRGHLKSEIGVFYPMVLLKLAEQHQQATAQHQQTTIKCLRAVCEDKQALFDIFVNYDCDVDSSNLFERTVNVLFRLAQERGGGYGSPSDASGAGGEAEGNLHFDAMKVLLTLLESLQSFADKGRRPSPEQVAAAQAEDDGDGDGDGDDAAAGSIASEEEKYKQLKYNKNIIEEGVSLFNAKPKKGLKFLIENGKVGSGTPDEIAAFLKTTPGLDKTMIGDYLGSPEETNLAVLDAWVKELDFSGLTFDDAIRLYLRGFRLPGEAQKIDRMMEIFAHHFCKHNPGDFTSADTAYVLAYSVVMLNTDAHNNQVKVKMSKPDFLKNNRGIDDGKDLDEDYLGGIYDRITTNEIKMKPDINELGSSGGGGGGGGSGSSGGGGNALMDTIFKLFPGRRTESAYDAEAEAAILETQRQLAQQNKNKEQRFETATSSATVRPMLEITWAPLLAVYSVPYENSEEPTVVRVCLSAYKTVIITSGLVNMNTVRVTFLTSLAKFTSLHRPSMMNEKNVLALTTLLAVADEYGDVLKTSWLPTLRCVSCFQSIAYRDEHVIHVEPPVEEEVKPRRRSKSNTSFFGFRSKSSVGSGGASPSPGGGSVNRRATASPSPSGAAASASASAFVGVDGPPATALITDDSMLPPAALLESVEKDLITTRLFVKSQALDAEAIIDFFKALVEVSKEELADLTRPRIFSMQKLVEAAHFNMNRIRLVWSRIWSLLSEYFVFVGCHENVQVAMYAVDSIRQLAMKFLHRDELSNFNFQNEFLKPFVVVMRNSSSYDVRELILRCIGQMVLSNVSNIKSGWRSLFQIFKTAADDESSSIVKYAFEIIENIVRESFQYITETDTTTFTDCVECLIAFTKSKSDRLEDVSLNAIAFLRYCALQLAEGSIGELQHGGAAANGDSPAAAAAAAAPSPPAQSPTRRQLQSARTTWDDNELHVYFWFPLLSGLGGLTFDSRELIRMSALEVLFDILRDHGSSFNAKFWKKVFEAVLFPVLEPFLVGAPSEPGAADKYEASERFIKLTIDLFKQFYPLVKDELAQMLALVFKFVARNGDADTNNSDVELCCRGVDALVHLGVHCGQLFDADAWALYIGALKDFEAYTRPDVLTVQAKERAMIMRAARRRASSDEGSADEIIEESLTDTDDGSSMGAVSSATASTAVSGVGAVAGSGSSVDAETAESASADGGFLSEVVVATYTCYTRVHVAVIRGARTVFEKNSSSGAMSRTVKWELVDFVDGALKEMDAIVGGEAHASAWSALSPGTHAAEFPPCGVETACASAFLSILSASMAMCSDSEADDADDFQKLESRLVSLCCSRLSSFTSMEAPEPSTDAAALVSAILESLAVFPDKSFATHVRALFPLLCDLIESERTTASMRRAISGIFREKIPPLLA